MRNKNAGPASPGPAFFLHLLFTVGIGQVGQLQEIIGTQWLPLFGSADVVSLRAGLEIEYGRTWMLVKKS